MLPQMRGQQLSLLGRGNAASIQPERSRPSVEAAVPCPSGTASASQRHWPSASSTTSKAPSSEPSKDPRTSVGCNDLPSSLGTRSIPLTFRSSSRNDVYRVDIPVPDRSTTSRPIHADRRRPVVSASFDMPSLRAAAPIKCRLVAMVHSSLAVDAKTALLVLPPFVRLSSKTAPQASPNIAQPNEFEEPQDNHCPIEISTTTRDDLLLHYFDEPPRTSISNQLPDSTRHRIARELDKKPHNLTRRISIDRHLRSA